jgi:hypothetical protein
VHNTGTFRFGAQKGRHNYKQKNLVRQKLLVGFQPNFIGVISTIPSYAHHWHVPLRCTKWPPELKIGKYCPAFTGQTTGGMSTKFFTGVISTIPCCAHPWHIPLRCTKWPPELKIEKSCPAFTDQTTGWISTKLYRGDHFHP